MVLLLLSYTEHLLWLNALHGIYQGSHRIVVSALYILSHLILTNTHGVGFVLLKNFLLNLLG